MGRKREFGDQERGENVLRGNSKVIEKHKTSTIILLPNKTASPEYDKFKISFEKFVVIWEECKINMRIKESSIISSSIVNEIVDNVFEIATWNETEKSSLDPKEQRDENIENTQIHQRNVEDVLITVTAQAVEGAVNTFVEEMQRAVANSQRKRETERILRPRNESISYLQTRTYIRRK